MITSDFENIVFGNKKLKKQKFNVVRTLIWMRFVVFVQTKLLFRFCKLWFHQKLSMFSFTQIRFCNYLMYIWHIWCSDFHNLDIIKVNYQF